jgi:uncharacterized protein (DUF1778 family)
MPNPNRTALLIRCSIEEAEHIRAAARMEHRTVSGFVMNCLANKIRIHAAVQKKLETRTTRLAAEEAKALKD